MNHKFWNEIPTAESMDFENKDTEKLAKLNMYYQSKIADNTERIKSNVVFFFWLWAIGGFLFIISSLTSLGL